MFFYQMKKALFTAALNLFLAASSHAQAVSGYAALPVDSASGRVQYVGVVPMPAGVTTTQAFGRAKMWLSAGPNKKAIRAEDAASGLLTGDSQIKIKDFIYPYMVRLQVEPTGVRYKLEQFTFITAGSPSSLTTGTVEEQRDSKLAIGRGTRAKMLTELDQKVRASLAQLKAELAGSL